MPDLLRVNRAVAIVRPQEPFLEWADALDQQEPRARSLGIDSLTSAFLVPDVDRPKGAYAAGLK
jgi:hypothetical protein